MRLPLYAKILSWFFLNLALVAAVFILLFNAQFRFDLDWVFASSARERVDALRDLVVAELSATPPVEWDRVLERFSEAYRVRLALFDHEGHHLIGAIDEPPPEVRARMTSPGIEVPRERHDRFHGPPVRSFLRTSNPSRYWLLVSARPDSPQAGGPMHVILVAESNSLGVGGLIFDTTPWFRLAVGAVIFSVIFWLPMLRGITKSIGQMTTATKEIAHGRFDARVPARRGDELGVLADAINQMAARLDGFIKGQKRFLGDVAHELCSPLARLQMALGIIEQRADERQKTYAKSAIEKADQISALVNELLAFSRASFGSTAVRCEPVNVRAAAEQAVAREASDDAELRVEVPENLSVPADPELLVRALANLLRNAIRHGASPIVVSANSVADSVEISVADSGPGISEEELPKIFDAFYRVDPSRARETGGIGLGLTIVKTCVESCGGTVSARNRSPNGLEVTIHLPAERNESAVEKISV